MYRIHRWLLLFVPLCGVSIHGCIISAPPETRGWKCETSADCTLQLDCIEERCRRTCRAHEDCLAIRQERCIPISFNDTEVSICLSRCTPGQQRSCFEANPNKKDIGRCKSGVQQCSPEGRWSPCVGQKLPQQEVCNQTDDDCDGKIDNALSCACPPGQQRACFTGPDSSRKQSPCKEGIETCTSEGRWKGDCKNQRLPQPERCNQSDDDCDGKIDEKVIDQDLPCNVPWLPESPCQKGVTHCQEGQLRCKQIVQPKAEDCNGIDDDCDGTIDNFPQFGPHSVTRSCASPENPCIRQGNRYVCKGVCRAGAQTCNPKTKAWNTQCLNQQLPLAREQCNGSDDDCDGKTDNNAQCPSNQVCTQGQCQ
ncbi:MAG: MopE-related protein [Myxococcota bacterium]